MRRRQGRTLDRDPGRGQERRRLPVSGAGAEAPAGQGQPLTREPGVVSAAVPGAAMKRAILLMLWLTLAILGGGGYALAHAALVESHPADGASVEDAPATVRL